MPQRRRRPHGLSGRARPARDLWLGLSRAVGRGLRALALSGLLLPGAPAAADQAADLAALFAGEAFCLFVPPEPIAGVFEPDPPMATALARDHDKVLALEPALRRATTDTVVTLAPSEPFDAAMIAAGGPLLERIMHRLLWLYADYWQAARRVLVDGTETELPTLGLAPLRTACDPAVALFVFTAEDRSIIGAGYMSLLTGRVLAAWLPSGPSPD